MTKFCECESWRCDHRAASCEQMEGLKSYRLAGMRQTLCPQCAEAAEHFCIVYGYEFEVLVETTAQRRRAWHAGDWACACLLVATMLWMAFTILPAFLDGRVAQVVGR